MNKEHVGQNMNVVVVITATSSEQTCVEQKLLRNISHLSQNQPNKKNFSHALAQVPKPPSPLESYKVLP